METDAETTAKHQVELGSLVRESGEGLKETEGSRTSQEDAESTDLGPQELTPPRLPPRELSAFPLGWHSEDSCVLSTPGAVSTVR